MPAGVYVNKEYPAHMKRNRGILRPILKLAKSIQDYHEKSRLQGDKLVINGTYYSINNLAKLPPTLAAFKAVQKMNTESLVFREQLSPYSNFHYAPFNIDGQEFTSEHYIQYSKAMHFGDMFTANTIVNSTTPYKAKRLSYQINRTNTTEWQEKGYDICYKGVHAKFQQNPNLLSMLKATGTKTIAEASNDRT